jgi:hypothetical protein
MTAGRLATSMVLWIVMTQGPVSARDTPAEEGAWVTYSHEKADISFEHPAGWEVRPGQGSILAHLSHAEPPVHLVVAAFYMREGSLEDFAKLKLDAQRDIFRPVGPSRKIQGPGWEGLLQDADDIRPGRTENTRRVVLCANHKDRYVSLSLYLDPREFTPRQKYYERVFTSLRFGQ